jgi:hypothetical protein
LASVVVVVVVVVSSVVIVVVVGVVGASVVVVVVVEVVMTHSALLAPFSQQCSLLVTPLRQQNGPEPPFLQHWDFFNWNN